MKNFMYKPISKAEAFFNDAGPFFHLTTEPIEDDLLVSDEADCIFINNIIAIASFQTECRLLAFAIMSNHLHFILEGAKVDCMLFFEHIKSKTIPYFTKHGRGNVARRLEPKYIDINNLKQLRDEIVYVIRNPFVIRVDVNPLAYRWCSGFLYFNPFLDKGGVSAALLPVRAKREFSRSRNPEGLDARILVRNGVANPASFVDYERTMSFFDNVRQFLMWMFKNVEGQVETARRLGEMPHLNDDEVLSLSFKLCRSMFAVNTPRELALDKRKKLALKLKNEYSASNGQIARCVNLPLDEVNTLFPLSAKR